MAKLKWDETGEHVYEAGVSHGVFYGSDAKGIPWNGLTSVEEDANSEVDPLYFDGFKYADVVTIGDFSGSLKAFTYPDEFLPYEGIVADKAGFYLADQPKSRFGLSYKTGIGTDQDADAGYKIHILYNLIAIPSTKVYRTLSLGAEPTDFEWEISAIPEEVDRYRPTAHVILDSRKIDPFLLSDIENILYGTEETDPLLPDLNGLVTFVQKWGRLVITDNGDGTWTATTPLPDIITMVGPDEFEIEADNVTYLDADTYEVSSSDVDSGTIWPQ